MKRMSLGLREIKRRIFPWSARAEAKKKKIKKTKEDTEKEIKKTKENTERETEEYLKKYKTLSDLCEIMIEGRANFCVNPNVLYKHFTYLENLEGILREGLKPTPYIREREDVRQHHFGNKYLHFFNDEISVNKAFWVMESWMESMGREEVPHVVILVDPKKPHYFWEHKALSKYEVATDRIIKKEEIFGILPLRIGDDKHSLETFETSLEICKKYKVPFLCKISNDEAVFLYHPQNTFLRALLENFGSIIPFMAFVTNEKNIKIRAHLCSDALRHILEKENYSKEEKREFLIKLMNFYRKSVSEEQFRMVMEFLDGISLS